ncbi:MAG: aminodeoxychorismate/anthranilate synthase component II [Cohaesibacter sp.]|jgi:anthranilate synthase/aminodeoxychorismate synthase-like glutamine amidotransferase|nr:aminodeoxychorismate/anthranilate synthase component II [Cohaesibacter sp.]
MILILDNYDSFVFNLARYFEELGEQVTTYRNDALSLDMIARLNPDAILLSPGPCTPAEAGITIDVIKHFSGLIPILGICLGHQAIGAAFGGRITRAKEPMHGRATQLEHSGTGIFNEIPSPFRVARYHSLVIEPSTLKAPLQVTARSPVGEIMAVEHLTHPTYGLQFHPESVLTDHGHQLLKNFLELSHGWHKRTKL